MSLPLRSFPIALLLVATLCSAAQPGTIVIGGLPSPAPGDLAALLVSGLDDDPALNDFCFALLPDSSLVPSNLVRITIKPRTGVVAPSPAAGEAGGFLHSGKLLRAEAYRFAGMVEGPERASRGDGSASSSRFEFTGSVMEQAGFAFASETPEKASQSLQVSSLPASPTAFGFAASVLGAEAFRFVGESEARQAVQGGSEGAGPGAFGFQGSVLGQAAFSFTGEGGSGPAPTSPASLPTLPDRIAAPDSKHASPTLSKPAPAPRASIGKSPSAFFSDGSILAEEAFLFVAEAPEAATPIGFRGEGGKSDFSFVGTVPKDESFAFMGAVPRADKPGRNRLEESPFLFDGSPLGPGGFAHDGDSGRTPAPPPPPPPPWVERPLSVVIHPGKAVVAIGDFESLAIRVRNEGAESIDGLVVFLRLPSQFWNTVVTTETASSATIIGRLLSWSIADGLPAGGTVELALESVIIE